MRLPAFLLVLGACTPSLGEAVRPQEKTAKEALGEASSLEACEADYAKPIIIDISPEDRGDLEAKLKLGGPTVSFDCKSMKILPTCRYKNLQYRYVGYTPKAQLVEMETGDDLGAALPINGMKFKAGLERSGRLNLATMTVGQRTAGLLEVPESNLEGKCEDATHVVNSVWIGAFTLATGTKGEVMAAAEVFDIGAHAASKSARTAMTSDGDVKACASAKEDANAPPSGCTAFVRLELLKVERGGSKPATAGGDNDADERKVTCSEGREWNGATCVDPEGAACTWRNRSSCAAYCEKNDGHACRELAIDAKKRNDAKEETRLHEKACTLGEGKSCYASGRAAQNAKDSQAAARWYTNGCNLGDRASCDSGTRVLRANGELEKAYAMDVRLCALKGTAPCVEVAALQLKGTGTTKDVPGALKTYEQLCASGIDYASRSSCATLGTLFLEGKEVKKDTKRASDLFAKLCTPTNWWPQSCFHAAQAFDQSNDKPNATKYYGLACDKNNPEACKKVGRPAPPPANHSSPPSG